MWFEVEGGYSGDNATGELRAVGASVWIWGVSWTSCSVVGRPPLRRSIIRWSGPRWGARRMCDQLICVVFYRYFNPATLHHGNGGAEQGGYPSIDQNFHILKYVVKGRDNQKPTVKTTRRRTASLQRWSRRRGNVTE